MGNTFIERFCFLFFLAGLEAQPIGARNSWERKPDSGVCVMFLGCGRVRKEG